MSSEIRIFIDKTMSLAFSSDASYSTPVRIGDIGHPLDASGGESEAFPVWIKNTGSRKLWNIRLSASDGFVNASGGVKSATSDAFIELGKDDNSNLPDSTLLPPASFAKAGSSEESPEIIVDNIVTSNHQRKLHTDTGRYDDCGTMMPGEYCIVWIKGAIDAIRAPGQTVPVVPGIQNVSLSVDAFSTDENINAGSVPLGATLYLQRLLIEWHLDDGEGSIAEDSSGSDNDANLFDCSWWNIGVSGGSLNISQNGYIEPLNSVPFNIFKYMTFSFFIKSPEDYVSYGNILKKEGGNEGYSVTISEDGRLIIRVFKGANEHIIVTGDYLYDTGWHFINVAIDLMEHRVIVYIDNELSAEETIPLQIDSLKNDENLIVGHSFNGRIDEVSATNRILSHEDIELLYNDVWARYISEYGITDNGILVTDNNGRPVVDEVI